MNRALFSRRSMLAGLGSAGALLPLLGSTRARAEPGEFPCRVLIVVQTNGVIREHFYPTGAGTDLTTLDLPAMTAPLTPHRSKITFVGDLDMKNFTDHDPNLYGDGHGNYSCAFTGVRGIQYTHSGKTRLLGGGPTVDQYIAGAVGNATPVRVLNLGVRINEVGWHETRCFYSAAEQMVTPQNDPVQALDTVFAGLSPGDLEDPAFARQLAKKRSVLDHAGRQLETYASRLGAEDRGKLEAHLQSIRELEQQLDTTDLAGCSIPELPAHDIEQNDEVPSIWSAQVQVVKHAFACDRTRVATIQLNDAHGLNSVPRWVDEITSAPQNYAFRDNHDIAHHPSSMPPTEAMPNPYPDDKVALERWHMQQLAYVIEQLESVPEGEGTMLDNTIVLWANHMGNGRMHTSDGIPWILAGGGAGYLTPGRYLATDGAATNGVLKALCEAMGADPAGFGDPDYGGVLAGL